MEKIKRFQHVVATARQANASARARPPCDKLDPGDNARHSVDRSHDGKDDKSSVD